MPTYQEMLEQKRASVREVDARESARLREQGAILVDIREQDEVDQGIIPGAIHIPRGFLEMRIEETIRDRLRELDDREGLIEQREAGLEADIDIREDKIERREKELIELEGRLANKESELATYVKQIQTQFTDRDQSWWNKVTGDDGAPDEAA